MGGADYIPRKMHRSVGDLRPGGIEAGRGGDGGAWTGEAWRWPGSAGSCPDHWLQRRSPWHPSPPSADSERSNKRRLGRLGDGPRRTPASTAAGLRVPLPVSPSLNSGDVHLRLPTAPSAGPPFMQKSGEVGLRRAPPQSRNRKDEASKAGYFRYPVEAARTQIPQVHKDQPRRYEVPSERTVRTSTHIMNPPSPHLPPFNN